MRPANGHLMTSFNKTRPLTVMFRDIMTSVRLMTPHPSEETHWAFHIYLWILPEPLRISGGLKAFVRPSGKEGVILSILSPLQVHQGAEARVWIHTSPG